MKPLLKVSPSQIKTWRRCKRKWAYQKILKRPEPSNAAAEYGSSCHALLEAHALGEFQGHGPKWEVAKQALEHLPQVFPPAEYIEAPINMALWSRNTAYDVELHGFSDLVLPPAGEGLPEIIDYKFSGYPSYAKTETTLRHDPQALIYGRWAMDQFASTDVRVTFLYLFATPRDSPRKPMGSRPVTITLSDSSDDFQQAWEHIEEDALAIAAAKFAGDPDLEANPSACKDFGGCPHADVCEYATIKPKQPTVGGSIVDILERLRADKQAVATAPQAVTVNPPVVDTEPARQPKSEGERIAEAIDEGRLASPDDFKPYKVADLRKAAAVRGIDGEGVRKTTLVHMLLGYATTLVPEPAETSDDTGLALYIDCLPLKGTRPVTAAEHFAPALDAVCQDSGVAHFSLIDYGKGPGAFAVAAAKQLQMGDTPSALFVDSRTPEGRVLKDVLVRLADKVVQGF